MDGSHGLREIRFPILYFETDLKIHNFIFFFLQSRGLGGLFFGDFSAISWQPVLVVEEAGVPGENH
jgi:hypothetical protein